MEDIIHVTPLRVLSSLVHVASMFVPWVQVFTTSTSSVYVGHLQLLFQAVLCPTGSLRCPSSTEENKNPGYPTTGKLRLTSVLKLISMMASCYCGTFINTGECSESAHPNVYYISVSQSLFSSASQQTLRKADEKLSCSSFLKDSLHT